MARLGVEAEVIKVTEYPEIMKYGILSTPGLVINGEVKTAGRLPNFEEIKKLIIEAKAA